MLAISGSTRQCQAAARKLYARFTLEQLGGGVSEDKAAQHIAAWNDALAKIGV